MLLRSGDLAGFARRLWRRLVALLSALGRLGGPLGHVQWRERWVDLTDGERAVVAGWASATRFAVVVDDGPSEAVEATVASLAAQLHDGWVLSAAAPDVEAIGTTAGVADWVVELEAGVVLHEAALATVAAPAPGRPTAGGRDETPARTAGGRPPRRAAQARRRPGGPPRTGGGPPAGRCAPARRTGRGSSPAGSTGRSAPRRRPGGQSLRTPAAGPDRRRLHGPPWPAPPRGAPRRPPTPPPSRPPRRWSLWPQRRAQQRSEPTRRAAERPATPSWRPTPPMARRRPPRRTGWPTPSRPPPLVHRP